ncbi:MAG TPA: VWA domain-containing protein [Vicinamibacterales bacterium]|nr:VWA domain-containing protein [Vicinamibacterales bacterium]
MGRRWLLRFAILVLLGMAAASASAQSTPGVSPAGTSGAGGSDPTPLARVVRIDAVVTDRLGRPILDLEPGDFEVVEDGVVQKLHAVELRSAAARPAGTTALPPIASPLDEELAAREPGARVFALLLDEFHVSAGPNSERVRETFSRFLDQHIRPSDLIAVLRPLESVTDIRFTRGSAAARQAIQEFSGRKGDYEARTEFEEKYIGRAPETVRAARAQIVMSGLRALTSRLGELAPDRAAIVLVSEGFTGARMHERARRVPDVQGLVRSASRAHVAVYAFNPAGAAGPSDEADEVDNSRRFLQTLAGETGGEAVLSAAAMQAGLERVSRDLDGYYLLSYTSSHAAAGRFYDVQVRTRRRDAVVRARTGYWAPAPSESHGAEGRPAAPRRVLRRSPLIDTWLGFTVSADGVQQVTFTWEPAESRGPGKIQRPSVVALKVTTREGALLFEDEISAPRADDAVGRQEAAFFEAPPGPIQLDLAIFAADGTQIDTAAHDVEVPNSRRADPLILPPQVFRSASAREFREISRDPAAAPVPAREFRRTERLLLRVPTHSRSGASIALDARILNRTGQALRPIEPMKATVGAGIVQFDVPLGWLAPGEYAIELNAKSAAGAAKEIVRFKVTG